MAHVATGVGETLRPAERTFCRVQRLFGRGIGALGTTEKVMFK